MWYLQKWFIAEKEAEILNDSKVSLILGHGKQSKNKTKW